MQQFSDNKKNAILQKTEKNQEKIKVCMCLFVKSGEEYPKTAQEIESAIETVLRQF